MAFDSALDDSNITKESVFGHSSIWKKDEIWNLNSERSELPELNRCSTPVGCEAPTFSTGRKVTFAGSSVIREYEMSEKELYGKRFWNRFLFSWRRFNIIQVRLFPNFKALTYAERRMLFNNYRRSIPCENATVGYCADLDFNNGQQAILAPRFL